MYLGLSVISHWNASVDVNTSKPLLTHWYEGSGPDPAAVSLHAAHAAYTACATQHASHHTRRSWRKNHMTHGPRIMAHNAQSQRACAHTSSTLSAMDTSVACTVNTTHSNVAQSLAHTCPKQRGAEPCCRRACRISNVWRGLRRAHLLHIHTHTHAHTRTRTRTRTYIG